MHYENEIKERRCPLCGMLRPYDWYAPPALGCWKCRALKANGKEGAGNGKHCR